MTAWKPNLSLSLSTVYTVLHMSFAFIFTHTLMCGVFVCYTAEEAWLHPLSHLWEGVFCPWVITFIPSIWRNGSLLFIWKTCVLIEHLNLISIFSDSDSDIERIHGCLRTAVFGQCNWKHSSKMPTSSSLVISFSYLCYSKNMLLIVFDHTTHVKKFLKSIYIPYILHFYQFLCIMVYVCYSGIFHCICVFSNEAF